MNIIGKKFIVDFGMMKSINILWWRQRRLSWRKSEPQLVAKLSCAVKYRSTVINTLQIL